MKKRRTPRQKKDLSLAKDCRNAYWANDKASRKGIPRRRARKHREYRRSVREAIKGALVITSDVPEGIEAAADRVRRGSWQKSKDVPLREMIDSKRKKSPPIIPERQRLK